MTIVGLLKLTVPYRTKSDGGSHKLTSAKFAVSTVVHGSKIPIVISIVSLVLGFAHKTTKISL